MMSTYIFNGVNERYDSELGMRFGTKSGARLAEPIAAVILAELPFVMVL